MADALFVVLMTTVHVSSPAFIPGSVLFLVMQIWLLRRFGILALAAQKFTEVLTDSLPFTVTSWYAALSLTTPLVIASVAAWSLYAILSSRPGTASRPATEPLA